MNALYEGWVGHRRLQPVDHRFRYRVFMAYLDLDAVPESIGPAWLWSTSMSHSPCCAKPTSAPTLRRRSTG